MNDDKNLEQSLQSLNEDIIWKEGRKEHVRQKLVHHLQQDTQKASNTWRKKIIPAFSVVCALIIVSVIALYEFGGADVLTFGENPSLTAASQGVAQNFINENTEKINEILKEDKPEDDNSPPPQKDEEEALDEHEDTSEDRLLTQEEIMTAIKGQMTSDIPLKLPTEISLPEGKHLTAVTDSLPDAYEVVFFQHDEPIPINNQLLLDVDNPAEVVARVHVEEYLTEEEADDAIGFVTFDDSMGEAITLHEGLTVFQDSGAGSTYTSWNVGRWAITTRGQTNQDQASLDLAREVVEYLHIHLLPAPNQHGYARLDAHNNSNEIIWQQGKTVYTIEDVQDPIQALEITVHFE